MTKKELAKLKKLLKKASLTEEFKSSIFEIIALEKTIDENLAKLEAE